MTPSTSRGARPLDIESSDIEPDDKDWTWVLQRVCPECGFDASDVPGPRVAGWVRENRRHDLVIVPTESSRDAWLAAGMPVHRVRVCPLGTGTESFSGTAAPLPLLLEDGQPVAGRRTRFLNISEVVGRKNLAGLLEAWVMATTAADDAVLIVKAGCYQPGSWDRLMEEIERVERRTGKSLADAAPVSILRGAVADSQMPSLYTAATHYISMSFGEGWDLPMTEAAASGLRLIAPAHSAYLAYLDASIARMLPVREMPAGDPGDAEQAAFLVGSNWWEPDCAAAVEAIRAAIDGRDTPLASARARIAEHFTWGHAARRLTAIIDELEDLRAKIPPVAALRANRGGSTGSRRSPPDDLPTPDRS